MSEPVAFYRGDWKGDLVFRKNNTVDVRKNKSDFTKGLIKPLYADNPNQPQLTIPKSIADELEGFNPNEGETKIAVLIEGYNECFISDELMQFCLVDNNLNLCALYLAGKSLGVDLVKVVEG